MYDSCEVDAHACAVATLQARLSALRPGSLLYRIVERALDLAFNCVVSNSDDLVNTLLTAANRVVIQQIRSGLIVDRRAQHSASGGAARSTLFRRIRLANCRIPRQRSASDWLRLSLISPAAPGKHVSAANMQGELWPTDELAAGSGYGRYF